MMLEQLKKDIREWVTNFVSVRNEKLGTIPCPFAKQALIDNSIDYAVVQDIKNLESLITLYAFKGLNSEVLIIGMDKNNITADELSSLITTLNINLLMPENLVALEDHPDNAEIINDVKLNQGTWVLVLIQSLTKINHASSILEKQGYYKNWPKEAIDDVVSWRFKKE